MRIHVMFNRKLATLRVIQITETPVSQASTYYPVHTDYNKQTKAVLYSVDTHVNATRHKPCLTIEAYTITEPNTER
jgi:hypothetical protein